MVKKVKKTKKKVKEEKPRELSETQELFCQYFIFNDEVRGNATQCYAEANGIDFEELSRDDAVYSGEGDSVKLISPSTYAKTMNVCSVMGHKWLRQVKMQDRLVVLRNELLRDDIVDSQLAKVIMQESSLHAKMLGISEYNKLKSRITEKHDITSDGEPIATINYLLPNGHNDKTDSKAA